MLSPLQAQKPGVHKATPAEIKKEDKKKAEPTEPVPLYQGTSIGVEIAGLGSYLLGSDILNTEIAVQANLKNRFLPVIEVGYGKADAINDGNNLHYKTSAPYFRIGMDYNVFYKKTHLPGYLYVGLRYGMSSFSYDVDGPSMESPFIDNPLYIARTPIPGVNHFPTATSKAGLRRLPKDISLS